jgi:glycosyltransferase involved in cell wall biosynthesis
MVRNIQLGSIFNIFCYTGGTVSHTFFSLNQGMNGAGIDCHMFVPNCDDELQCSNMTESVPRFLKPPVYRFPNGPRFFTESLFLQNIGRFEAAYVFPDASLGLLKKIKKKGVPLLSERINCHTKLSRQILDKAYEELKLAPNNRISDEMIAQEDEQLALSDFIFCPSPQVSQSLITAGVPEAKLIPASFGWSPDRFAATALRSKERRKHDPLTVLFVGSICVRKGAHILLKAWEKAKINGRLLLCGKLDPEIKETCGYILDRADVIWNDFQTNIGQVYTNADLFAFPSFEEGGPLVTYEAMAHCMPVVVSPMGAGAIVRDKIDGIIVSDQSEENWTHELRRLADDVDLRDSLGQAAGRRAQKFTWKDAGVSRARSAIDKLSRLPAAGSTTRRTQ